MFLESIIPFVKNDHRLVIELLNYLVIELYKVKISQTGFNPTLIYDNVIALISENGALCNSQFAYISINALTLKADLSRRLLSTPTIRKGGLLTVHTNLNYCCLHKDYLEWLSYEWANNKTW